MAGEVFQAVLLGTTAYASAVPLCVYFNKNRRPDLIWKTLGIVTLLLVVTGVLTEIIWRSMGMQ